MNDSKFCFDIENNNLLFDYENSLAVMAKNPGKITIPEEEIRRDIYYATNMADTECVTDFVVILNYGIHLIAAETILKYMQKNDAIRLFVGKAHLSENGAWSGSEIKRIKKY